MFQKKSLAQHFLRDRAPLAKIADAANLAPDDTVLEVGPGEGVLTELLLKKAGKVIAVEKDNRLIPVLMQKFAQEISQNKLDLIHGDILDFDPSSLNAKRYTLTANLPYYITGAFLRKFLQETEHPPVSMTLLMQKEVARRIVAADGRESVLSLSVKAYGAPRYIATVKAGAFSPPPKVDSAILAIERISKTFFSDLAVKPSSGTRLSLAEKGFEEKSLPRPTFSEKSLAGTPFSKGRIRESEARFFETLKKGFAHPRKLLSSNLDIQRSVLQECGIAPNARAETVSPAQWKCLTRSLCGRQSPTPKRGDCLQQKTSATSLQK